MVALLILICCIIGSVAVLAIFAGGTAAELDAFRMALTRPGSLLPPIDLTGPMPVTPGQTRAGELAEAIANGQVEPFFQPFIELGSGRVLGFEVLARWRLNDDLVRMPGEFIHLAEEHGLVGAMYDALLGAAASEATGWPEDWSIAMNLSAVQLTDPDLVPSTMRILRKAGLAPQRLELEIAESALEPNQDCALDVMQRFRARGVRIVLDNFGSGRMHLYDLARFPFDRIKVDQGAFRPDGASPGVALGLIAAAARHLGVPVLVQGIETRDGAEAAIANGCSIGQGFLYGRPDRRTECFRMDGALGRGRTRAA